MGGLFNGCTSLTSVSSLPSITLAKGCYSSMFYNCTSLITPPPVLPEAYAIINPHQQGCAYPFKQLAGVGVAFKLCQALFKKITGSNELWRGHLEFVAMGTVADIVPLVGENRELVRMGLKSFRKTSSKGLRELIRVAQIAPTKQITSETIARMHDYLIKVLVKGIENPDVTIGELFDL